MSTGTLLAIIISVVVLIVVIAAVVTVTMRRRRRLRRRFGPEYDRTVADAGSRREAEHDLDARESRHDSLDIRPLPAAARNRYQQSWSEVQEEFVDRPDEAVGKADRLVTALMRERGYPTEGYEQQMRDLSVEHGRTLEHYRTAHDTLALSSSEPVTTEQLRGAMVHYRALFEELLEDSDHRDPDRS
ncbi:MULTISPECIES: hypothetical protein [unclassified Streptomyces]|uniref:hypothetical protein n=1 Tax=unclassified Streptomyces TaxID=2593676 RepID=UPI0033B82E18